VPLVRCLIKSPVGSRLTVPLLMYLMGGAVFVIGRPLVLATQDVVGGGDLLKLLLVEWSLSHLLIRVHQPCLLIIPMVSTTPTFA